MTQRPVEHRDIMRRSQFRLRSLFVLTGIVAAGCAVGPLIVCEVRAKLFPPPEENTVYVWLFPPAEAATPEALGRELGKRWATAATEDQVRQVQDVGHASGFAADVWKHTTEGKQRARDFVATHRLYLAGAEWRPPEEFVKAFNEAVLDAHCRMVAER
jgi:hypothetical protein